MKLVTEIEDSETFRLLEEIVKEESIMNILDNVSLSHLLRFTQTLKFSSGDIVVKRKEEQDMLLIVLQGQLQMSINHKAVGQLGKGQIYGMMNALELDDPLTYHNHFDLIAQQEGTMLILLPKQMRKIMKQMPQLYHKLYRILCRKAVNMFNRQYQGTDIITPPFIKENLSSPQDQLHQMKSLLALHSSFIPLVNAFKPKDYQLIYHYSRYVQFTKNTVLVQHQNYMSNGLVILILKGSLNVFDEDKSKIQTVYAGTLIGSQQLLFGINWSHNVIANSDGVALFIHHHQILNILNQSPNTLHIFISFLITNEFNNIAKDNKQYVEIDSTTDLSNQEILDMIEKIRIQKLTKYQAKGDYPDLYTHQIYQTQKKKIIKEQQNEKVKLPSSFLLEKQDEQRMKGLQKTTDQMGQSNIDELSDDEKKKTISEAYDEMQLRLKQQNEANNLLRQEMESLREKLEDKDELVNDLRRKQTEHIQMVRKHKTQIEMMSNQQQHALLDHPNPQQHIKFNTIIKSQLTQQRHQALAIKYAHKWLHYTFKNKSKLLY